MAVMNKFVKAAKNLWGKTQTVAKVGAIGAPAAVGLGYAGMEAADWNHRRNEQGVVDQTGIKGDRLPNGDVTYKDSLADVLPYDPSTGLGRTDARRGMPATFGPSPSGNSLGNFLNTQIAAFGKDETPDKHGAKSATESDMAALFAANQGSEIPLTAVKTIEGKPHILMNDAQRAEYTKANTLDASGMDGDLAALRQRYADRESRQNKQIRDIEDRPYQVDLSPVMALWKSWYGSDFGNYKRPETVDERMARVYQMRDKMEQEATQRDEALFNFKNSLEGRKLQTAQHNETQRIAAMDRGLNLDVKQEELGHTDAQQKIQQAQFGANHKLAQQTLNNTIRNQNQSHKIEMLKAMKGDAVKREEFLEKEITKSLTEDLKDKFTKGNASWYQAIMAHASFVAASKKAENPAISNAEALRLGISEGKRVYKTPESVDQKK